MHGDRRRLAGGQTLTDSKGGLVESLGTFTRATVNAAADVATAPTMLVDPTLHEKTIDAAPIGQPVASGALFALLEPEAVQAKRRAA